jgi:hypothetical protein
MDTITTIISKYYILNKDAKLLESIGTEYLERGYGYNRHKVKEFIKNKK